MNNVKKLFSSAIIVCFVMITFFGCSKDNAQPTGQDLKAQPTKQDLKLSAVDKPATGEQLAFSLKIPSTWTFSSEIDYESEDSYILLIDCLNSDIYMWAQQADVGAEYAINEYRELMKNNKVFSTVEDFNFADGGKGYCMKNETLTVFVNITDNKTIFANNGALLYSINHGGNLEWYNENEALIGEIAKTLSFKKTSSETVAPASETAAPDSPTKTNLPNDMDITLIREGEAEILTGTLYISSENGYAMYLLPDFNFAEEGGVGYIQPKPEAEIMPEIMMTIYKVEPETTITEGFEEYADYLGQPVISEFRRFTTSENTFEIQIMYPQEATEGWREFLVAMADIIIDVN